MPSHLNNSECGVSDHVGLCISLVMFLPGIWSRDFRRHDDGRHTMPSQGDIDMNCNPTLNLSPVLPWLWDSKGPGWGVGTIFVFCE